MQFIAHPEQKILRLFELRDITRVDHARERQPVEIFYFELGTRNPTGRLNIAQTALTFLDVGLEQINRAAELFMPSSVLFELFADKSFDPLFYQPRLDSFSEILVERVIAAQKPGVEKRRAHFHVDLRKAHAFGDAACRVPDLQPGVPKGIEQLFRGRLDKRRNLPGIEKQEIDIGEWIQFASTVTALG